MAAAQFLRDLVAVVLYAVPPCSPTTTSSSQPRGGPARLRAHLRPRLPRQRHPAPAHHSEASQDERTGRADEPHDQGGHCRAVPPRLPRSTPPALQDFITAYNFGRRLKTLKELTPYKYICKRWTNEPKRFKFDQSVKCGTKHIAGACSGLCEQLKIAPAVNSNAQTRGPFFRRERGPFAF